MAPPTLVAEWPWILLAAAATGAGYAAARLTRSKRSISQSSDGMDDLAALEAVRVAEEKYRSIFENAVEGIFQTTPQGKYLSANPRLAKIYGYPSADALIDSLQNIERQLYVDPLRRCEFTRLMEERDEIRDFESQIFRRDGSIIWISENARAIRDRGGRLLYYEGTVEDITARKQAAGWQAEKDAAVAANEAKTMFLAHMSHEIRTPLNGVIGMLQLLTQSFLDERETRYVQIAHSSAENLLAIINDVLDFSKIEAGKLELETLPFSLHELLEDVTELFSHRALAQGLELSCRVSPDVPAAVCGDVQRLRQVLINLLGNALKFTREGHVVVRAELVESTCELATVRLTVRDTGIGIPPGRTDRLFAPFSQVDASTTRKFGGTGLGLAICRQIVELMGGRIGVESEVGCGSTFSMEIPLQLDAAPAAPSSGQPRQLAGLRVLAVDHQPASVSVLRDLFGCWGMPVIDVATPDAARKLLREAQVSPRPFILAVLSHHLPHIDAVQLAAELRNDPQLARLPLMVLTSIDADINRSACAAASASLLTKPIRQSRLYDLLAAALEQPVGGYGRNRRAPAAPRSETERTARTAACDETVSHTVRPRLLVAEDNDINQLVTNEILRLGGYDCDLVTNGLQAVNALRRGGYDLVLMDCHMPELDGLAATRVIRKLEASNELPHGSRGPIPIIALTANAIRGDREQCLAAGMTDYATKPVNREELLATIAKYIQAPQQPPERKTQDFNAPVSPDVLDTDSLLDRCAGDEAFAQQLLTKFRDRLPQSYEEIATAVERRELAAARRLAHTLKGTAANLGAIGLRSAAAELEATLVAEGGLAESDEKIPRRLAELERQAEHCLDRLDVLLSAERTAV